MPHPFFILDRGLLARLLLSCSLLLCSLFVGSGCRSSFGDDVAGNGGKSDTTDIDPSVPDASAPDGGEPTESEPTEPIGDRVDGGAQGPQVVNTEPRPGAMDVEPSARVSLIFDQPVEAGEGSVRLFESITQTQVAAVAIDDEAASLEDDTLVIDWDTPLANSTAYYVLVDRGTVQDADGEPFAGISSPTAFSFTTVAPSELTLVSTSPTNGKTRVPRVSTLVLTFSAPILAGAEGDVTIVDAELGVPFEVIPVTDPTRLSFEGPRLTVDPHGVFDYGRRYYVTLTPGALRSAQGVEFAGFAGEEVLSFTTVPPPAITLLGSVPAKGAGSVDPRASLVLTFSEAVNAGSGSVKLWREAEELVEEVNIRGPRVTLSDVTVTVDWVNELEFDTAYYVTIDAGALLSQRGASYAGLSDPTALDFTTAATDLGTVTLESTSPLAGATDVGVTPALVLVFSEDVEMGSGTIALFEAGDTLVQSIDVSDAARVSIDGDSVTVTPGVTLNGSTLHYVRVSAGSFQNTQGAAFAGISGESEWSFTTEQVFGVISRSPADDAVGADPATDLVLTFSESVTAGSGNVAVYTATDALVESIPVTSSRVTVSGSTVTVDLDRILGSETEYYVKIDAGAFVQSSSGDAWAGFQASTNWNFTTRKVDFPGNVTNGLLAWFDASYAASIKTSSAQVRLWADRSGRHNDVTAGGDARPALNGSAINSKPALRFDGTNDLLQAAAGFPLTSFDVFVVWQSASAPNTTMRSIVVNGTNFQVNHSHPYAEGRNSTAICQGTCPSSNPPWHAAVFTPTPRANTPYLWNAGFDPITTTVLVRSQGSAPINNTSPTTTPSAPATPFGIGGGCPALDCFFSGDVAEVVLYSRLLTPDERMAVVAALRSKWELPQVACGADEQRGPNGSCYFLGTNTVDWNTARTTCRNRGAGWDLATIRSSTEHDWLVANLLTAETAIGATDAEVDGVWRWVSDGLQFWSESSGSATNGAYTKWSSIEPTGGASVNCSRYVLYEGSWSWADYTCSQAQRYLCEGPGD